ncbi:MAG: Lipopolysaccharide-assembly, LptC-related [Sphingobacteriales bacterium]|nr:Lipopolysaccharide-assembly, LptC-related [Sphingobacteriales bacterium]
MFKMPFVWGFLCLVLLLTSSCENDLKDVEKISSKQLAVPVDISKGVTIVYSDSALVKAQLQTPLLYHYKDKDYYEMTKGVTIIFYDKSHIETSRVTADYGKMKVKEKLTELKRNVVVVNKNGKKFKSEELIWDQASKKFYSNKLVSMQDLQGQVLYGTSFISDDKFLNPQFTQATGNLSLSQKVAE